MTFYTFMTKRYIDSETPKDDLARDMRADKERFPRNGHGKFRGWYRLIRDYLENSNACTEALSIFDECWEEYVRCEKGRLKQNCGRRSNSAEGYA